MRLVDIAVVAFVASILPGPAHAAGTFAAVEAGYHRIVPVSDFFSRVLEGDKGSALLGIAVGHEFAHGIFVSAQASRVEFHPRQGFYSPARYRGVEPSTVRYLPLLAAVGIRAPAAGRIGVNVSIAAGVAHQKLDSVVLPRIWSRSTWRPAWRVTVGGDHGAGPVRVGARAAWLFLPHVRIQQMPKHVDFGGLGIAATLSFGHRAVPRAASGRP